MLRYHTDARARTHTGLDVFTVLTCAESVDPPDVACLLLASGRTAETKIAGDGIENDWKKKKKKLLSRPRRRNKTTTTTTAHKPGLFCGGDKGPVLPGRI